MASHALPLALVQNPSVGEASDVIVGLPLIRALRVVNAGHHGGVPKKFIFKSLMFACAGLKRGSLISARNFCLSLISPSHSVLTNRLETRASRRLSRG